jgi:hypothetical protein
MKFIFAVTVELTRVEEPSEIEAKIEGTPLGIVGRLVARSITKLADAGDQTKVPMPSTLRLPASSAASANQYCAPRPRNGKTVRAQASRGIRARYA